MRAVAVIDIGKTNAKLAIVDRDSLRELQVLTTPNPVIESAPYPHFNTTHLWDFIVSALTTLGGSYDICGISITTHGASIVLLDQHGNLATPILDYECDYPERTADIYNNIRPPFEHTGSPRLAIGLNVGAQLHWQFTEFPDLHNRVHTVLTYPQYWAYRLSGIAANEVTSLGCHTDLWNPFSNQYSALVDTLNIRDKMAAVQPASAVLGPILPNIASATGLPSNTPVYCGIHDSNASLLTHLQRIDGPFSVVSTGTWVICLSPGSSDLSLLDESKDTLLNVNAYGQPTPSSRFMGGREYDYLVAQYDAVETRHVIVNEATTSAFILPAVESSSGPYPHHTYQWTIDPQTLTAEERYNVISFYLAMMTDTCLRLCQASGPIIIEGPFAGNPCYCAMLAAATGREVRCQRGSSTGTSIGAALLAPTIVAEDNNQYQLLSDHQMVQALDGYADGWRHHVALHVNEAR
ncbi:MAG: FGGY-family carbohydrate kinase [Pseudomonadota bacterium]